MDQYKICHKCKQKYTQHPAISRKDNKTKICPICGIKEVLMQFIQSKKKNKEFVFPVLYLFSLYHWHMDI